MAPATLTQHPGKLVARYVRVTDAGNDKLFLGCVGTFDFRIAPQHDLLKLNLQQRLGRWPNRLAPHLCSPHGVAHVKFDDFEHWKAKIAWKWDDAEAKMKIRDVIEINEGMENCGFVNVSWAQIWEQLENRQDELDVDFGRGRLLELHIAGRRQRRDLSLV
jgi:hypothetical protein